MSTVKAQSYVPTTEELNDSIASFLKEVRHHSENRFELFHSTRMQPMVATSTHTCCFVLLHPSFRSSSHSHYHHPQNQTLDAKKARDHVVKQHPNWRVPERRVRKFVKRQVAAVDHKTASTGGAEDEGDDHSVTSVTKRVKGMVKKIFGGAPKKKKAAAVSTTSKDEAPMAEIQTHSILPDLTPDNSFDAETNLLAVPEAAEVDRTLPFVATTTGDDDGKNNQEKEAEVYKDDNDGKKEGGCCAPVGEACVVL